MMGVDPDHPQQRGPRRLVCSAAPLLLLAAGALAGGCNRPSVPAPKTPPATAPATQASAASQPSTRATSCLINVNGHMTLFPAARLRLESDGQRLVAMLFSDDPKDALSDNYTGNSFYLRFTLDTDDPEQLLDARWHYVAPSSGEAEDSPYGIYLGGRKLQLQPYDVSGRFKSGDQGTEVLLSGQFKILDDTALRGGPAQMVPVAAELPVKVEQAGELSH